VVSLHPVLFKIGSLTFYTYGLMVAIAFIVATFIVRHQAIRKSFKSEIAYDLAILALLGGLLGARIFYVLGRWSEFATNPLSILAIWQGGFVWYGGLIGGATAILLWLRRKKYKALVIADMIAPGLAIGVAIGRLGCLANGCCYGVKTSLPWGIVYTNPLAVARPLGEPLHPTQLYEFAYNLVIFSVIWVMGKRVKQEGFIFGLYLGMYGFFRFLVEFVRVNPKIVLGMSASQLFSLLLFLAVTVILFSSLFKAAKEKRSAREIRRESL
jgi:phosphatidylglycerol:prolipoprotein diacylglycerol transferase